MSYLYIRNFNGLSNELNNDWFVITKNNTLASNVEEFAESLPENALYAVPVGTGFDKIEIHSISQDDLEDAGITIPDSQDKYQETTKFSSNILPEKAKFLKYAYLKISQYSVNIAVKFDFIYDESDDFDFYDLVDDSQQFLDKKTLLIKTLNSYNPEKYPPAGCYAECLSFIALSQHIEISKVAETLGNKTSQEIIDIINNLDEI